jgi:hypothetical protein
MDEEARNEEEQAMWEEGERERKERDEEATAKKREQRNKRRKKGKAGGNDKVDADETGNGVKKPLLVPMPKTNSDVTGDAGIGLGKIVEEVGITIHDDD